MKFNKSKIVTGMMVLAIIGTMIPVNRVFADKTSDISIGKSGAVGEFLITSSTGANFANSIKYAIEEGRSVIRLKKHMPVAGAEIDSSISKIVGGEDFDTKQKELGYSAEESMTFRDGARVEVRNIDFNKKVYSEGLKVVIEDGAEVTFINCNFDNTIINRGYAKFEKCTFPTGFMQVGNAMTDIDKTKVHSFESGKKIDPLDAPMKIKIVSPSIRAIVGRELNQEIAYTLTGTNASRASILASIDKNNSGIGVSVVNGKIKITGTPIKRENITIRVIAQAKKADSSDEIVEEEVVINVEEELEAQIIGSAPVYGVGMSNKGRYFTSSESTDTISGATGSVGAVVSSESGSLNLSISENGNKISYGDFKRLHPNANVSLSLSPEGSGLNPIIDDASTLLSNTDTRIKIEEKSTDPRSHKPGNYKLMAKVTMDNKVVETNKIDINIYDLDDSLKKRLKELPNSTSYWVMEPYKIWKVEDTVIPTNLRGIYGSTEKKKGLYGEIGSNLTYATETITLPAGSNFKLENMKVFSSVKIVVEKGAKLTLNKSVVFGPIEVRGGTISSKDSSSTNTITLEDSSTLENFDIKSYSTFLTDASTVAPDATEKFVVVNGNIRVKGDNRIIGDKGFNKVRPQNALTVNNAKVNIEKGAVLIAQGGGDNTINNNPFSKDGGDGIVLNNSEIAGEGILYARGGTGYFDTLYTRKPGNAGNGVSGIGKISVALAKLVEGDRKNDKILGTELARSGKAYTDKIVITSPKIELNRNAGMPVMVERPDVITAPTKKKKPINIDVSKEPEKSTNRGIDKDTKKNINKDIKDINKGINKVQNEAQKKNVKEFIKFHRISDNDRIGTAVKISKSFYLKAENVIVVRSDQFPDSMTASVLSKVLKAPILLTRSNSLDTRVMNEIIRLRAKNITIVGGNLSIDSQVERDLEKLGKVERIAGVNRYETSDKIARKIVGMSKVDTVVIASGEVYADALSASSFAARDGYPILLVKKDSIPQNVEKVIKEIGVKNTYVVGGRGSISKHVESNLPSVIERFSGTNRYETAIKIANSKFMGTKSAYMASGNVFSDALVIGPLAARDNAPLILDSRDMEKSVKSYIESSKIEEVKLIGGKYVLRDRIYSR